MAKKLKDTKPVINRQINAVLKDEMKAQWNELTEAKNELFQLFQSRENLTLAISDKRNIVDGIATDLDAKVQTLKDQYGDGELDLDAGIYRPYAQD